MDRPPVIPKFRLKESAKLRRKRDNSDVSTDVSTSRMAKTLPGPSMYFLFCLIQRF